ncbi:methyl-accepting chemotaxis protein [Aquitalea aquatilis]|uniref:methyl-accepting chemotaxis protein n=1 Tax=Aquitalea aquatilis TaxID=1537400 RepID=UPI0010BD7D5A|nr:methyl-accepting chemotaxis protein [Aquitalea aquatilis]
MFSTIRNRLLLLIMVPLLVLSSFSLLLLVQNYNQYQKAQQTRNLMELAIASGNLIHSMQIERGASAGYLQSHGQKFADKLPEIRKTTDTKRQAYLLVIAGNHDMSSGVNIQKAKDALQELAGMREQISHQGTLPAQSSAYYSQTIATLLKSISTIGKDNDQADIVRRLQAYLALIQAKENVGLERALSLPAFISDKIEWPQYRAILAKIDNQDVLLNQFEGIAQPAEVAALKSVLSSDASVRVEQFRGLMESHFMQGGFNVTADQWFDAITSKMNALYGVEQQLSASIDGQTQALEAQALRNLLIVGVVGLVTVLFSAGIGLWVGRSIGGPLLLVARSVERSVETRDLSCTVHAEGVKETRQIGNAFNNLMDAFSHLILDVQGCGKDMGTVAEQLSSSSNQVRQSASVQSEATASVAAAVEQTAVSMTEMSTSTRSVMAQVQGSRSDTGQALQTMKETVRTVGEIARQIKASGNDIQRLNASSKEIGGIIDVISDIADQTNLLALNAAIEAARAGETGRGFAVVADEVRNLAARTGTATEQIASLILDVQKRIDATVAGMATADELSSQSLVTVGSSEQGLKQIDESSQLVLQRMQGIATAIEEQDQAMQVISQNVERIAQMTEENSVVAVQNNSQAEKLDQLAGRLSATISQYRISLS